MIRFLLLSLLPGVALADEVACHLSYGGESQVVTARPVASPYEVPAILIGSYFRFRVVFQKEPAEQAAVKVYSYADQDGGGTPIHQAAYAYPPAAGWRYGFTGLQSVYEPELGAELQYWCELRP